MSSDSPDYSTVEVPADTPPTEYTFHERRAEVLQFVMQAGSPSAINQSALARRYDVDRSQICRDMKRLRESIADSLGDDAKLTARAVYERTLSELQDADDWRAQKAAFDAMMDWNQWLADIGEQHREPNRSSVDVDMRSRHAEVAYTVVRDGDSEPLPTVSDDADSDSTTDSEQIDYEAVGFTAWPGKASDTDSADSPNAEIEIDE